MDIGSMTEDQIRNMLGDLVVDESPRVRKIKFPELKPHEPSGEQLDIGFLGDVTARLYVELGRSELTVREILELQAGSVIELQKIAGEDVEVFVNGRPFVSAEVVIINDAFGVRINSFLESVED